MKRFGSVLALGALSIVVGAAWTTATPQDQGDATQKQAKPSCCSGVESGSSPAASMPKCCLAKSAAEATPEPACAAGQCTDQLDKPACTACKPEKTKLAKTSVDEKVMQELTAGQCQDSLCADGEQQATCCQQPAAVADGTQVTAKSAGACEKCLAGPGEKPATCPECKGGKPKACPECSVAEPKASEAAKPQCELCDGDQCKQECADCAAARAVEKPETKQSPVASKAGPGRGMGHGHAGDDRFAQDHADFFFLIEHRDAIQRKVKNLANGIETLTESDNAEVAGMIQQHVESMYDRVENGNPIRMRDPVFREIFSNATKIKMEVEHTEGGVLVRETSEDPYVVKLLQEHAKVVNLFIKNGYPELPRNHAAPAR